MRWAKTECGRPGQLAVVEAHLRCTRRGGVEGWGSLANDPFAPETSCFHRIRVSGFPFPGGKPTGACTKESIDYRFKWPNDLVK